MKKIVFILGLSVLLGGAMPVQGSDVLEKIALYIPNRIVDAFDCFSATLGVGLGARAELAVTQAITVGAGSTVLEITRTSISKPTTSATASLITFI